MVAIPEEAEVKELAADLNDVEIKDAEIEEGSTSGKYTEVKESTNKTAVKNMNQNLLSHFWNLASLEETTRTESVVALLNELKASGKQDDLNYTAQRLVKGLSSSRKAARQGFATALTHVMKEFKEITTDKILELMGNHLAVHGNFKGQEERDAYFGQVFGILAIWQAKLKGDTSTMDINLVKKITESLLILIKKKSYLQETCGISMCDVLKYVDYTTYQNIQPLLEPILNRGWEKCSPEDLMIVLTVQSKFKNELPKKCFKEHWNRSEILHKSNFTHISRVLMDTTNTVHPRVHLLWDMILDHFLSSEKVDDGVFESFWKAIVEEGLMQSTHERKFLAMNIILKVVPKLPSDKVGIVFRECITRCIINSCQSKLNYLYNAVRNMLSKLPGAVDENKDKDTIPCVIKCLVGSLGHVCFDSITKTKTVEELALKISQNLPDYFNWLKDVFIAGTTNPDLEETKEMSEKDVNECRSWVANQLIILLRISKNQNAESLLLEIANFIFFHSYFAAVKKSKKEVILQQIPSHPLSDVTHQVCRQRFNTALAELANIFHTKSQADKQSIGGIAEDGEYYAWKILSFGKKLLEMPKYVQLSTPWTPEIYESWNHSFERISKMQVEGSKDESTVNSKGTQLLFIHATLQLFSNREEAVDVLKELETCYQKAEEKKRRKKTEPHWTEVLTEILLGFLAQSSHLMRQVVDLVYPTIIPHLTQDALDLLIKAITPLKKNEGDGMEFANDSDLEEIDNEEVNKDDGNECDDQTTQDDNKENRNEENNDDMSSDSEDGDDDSEDKDDSDMEVDEAFRAELKAALGDSAANSDEDTDENEDESEDDDIDMDTCDPKTLQQMDQALAAVFKTREQKKIEKKKKKDRKLSILHFKLRVLDLIEIFIKKQPKDKKILQLVEPLYEVIKTSHSQSDEQPLFERTLGIFKNKLCNLHEYPSGNDLDVDGVHDQIDHLIELAKTASSALLVTYITQAAIYLIRVLRGNPDIKEISPLRTRSHSKHKQTVHVEQETSQVGCLDEVRLIRCYKAALTDFMTKRSSNLQPVLFNELIQRFPSLGWKLAVDIPQYLNIGCNNFRKVKACEMIKLLFSKKTDKFEECLMEIQESMNTNIIKAFQATKEENYSLKARQFHDIIHIADIFFKEVSKYPKVTNEVDLNGIKASVTEALESPVVTRSTSLHSYCQTFLSTLNNTNNEEKPAKKRKK